MTQQEMEAEIKRLSAAVEILLGRLQAAEVEIRILKEGGKI